VRKTFGRNFEENDEEMAVKLTPKIRLGRRTFNQDGVAFFSNLKNAPKIILVGLDISNIGYLLQM
jgi:hypothetical protein